MADNARDWRGDAPQARPAGRYGWRPDDAARPRAGRRWVGPVLGLAAVGTVAAFVWVVTHLTPPPRPLFVAVGADPSVDGELLDVPPDLLGWQSGRRFLDAAAPLGGREPADGRSPLGVRPTDDGLADWMTRLNQKRFDPLVIYFGVHGWADGREPVLLVGGRDRLPVRKLLDALAAGPLAGKRIVLLLDPGRVPPEPAGGYIEDTFATAVRDLSDKVKENPNLVVLVGADAGQRGWESEELRSTVFADAVIRGLQGEAAGDTPEITARQLFEYVRGRVSKWAKDNRPGDQTPVLLPAGEDGLARAARVAVAIHPPGGPPPAPDPVPLALPADWKSLWDEHDALQRTPPHPAAYTPRLWRRYRELLVRYERATRVGDAATADRLAQLVRAAARGVARAKPLDPPPPTDFSLAVRAAIDPAQLAFDPLPALREHLAADRPPDPKLFGPTDDLKRPTELHLPLMARQFYRGVLTPPADVPAGWAAAVATKVRAERAALGLPAAGEPLLDPARWPGPAAAFSERVRPNVADIDTARRAAEDDAFGDGPPAAFADLDKKYRDAAAKAADARFAFHVRDAVFADLPYVSRWAAATPADTAAGEKLWADARRLNDQLADPAAAAVLATDVWRAYSDRRREFDAEVDRQVLAAAVQSEWGPKERLLATPLIRADQRQLLVVASREISGRLLREHLSATPRPASAAVAATATADPAKLLRLAAAEVGVPATAADVTRKYRELAATADEPAGRVSVPFDADRGPEPATVARNAAWQALLVDLADRAFLDHWHGPPRAGGGKPYYHAAATAYLDAADKLGEPTARSKQVRRTIDTARPLAVSAAEAGPVRWTSEPAKTVTFKLDSPTGVPPGGRAVGFRSLSFPAAGPPPVRLADPPARAAKPLGDVPLSVAMAASSDANATATGEVSAGVYFRGQRPQASLALAVTRRPELVIFDGPPKSRDGAVAVTAGPDVPLGAVALLLDYSASMQEGISGFVPQAGWRAGPSKYNLAIEQVRAVLGELPRGTPLKVRLFSGKDATGASWVSKLVYPPADGKPAVVWDDPADPSLAQLVSTLKGVEPDRGTPLIASIEEAAANDFPERAEGSKTLVVLTDGADSSGRPPAELNKRLEDVVKRTGVSVFVVQFALARPDAPPEVQAEVARAKQIFDRVEAWSPAGRVAAADDADGLRRELAYALWPKLTLAVGPPYPVPGWPARPPGPVGTLLWSPTVTLPGAQAVPTGTFPPRRGEYPPLLLEPGEFLRVRFAAHAKSGGLTVRREWHTESFEPAERDVTADRAWALAVPRSGIEDASAEPTFAAPAFLERVPPHVRTPGEYETVLRHQRPTAAWWHVSPADAAPGAGSPVGWQATQTVVSRLHGYPAPGWEVRVKGWPGTAPGRVRAWVGDGVPVEPFTLPLARDSERTVVVRGQTYRVSVERQVFADGTADECVVVRAAHPAGRPVQVRPQTPPAGLRVEHRHFRAADAYTGVFGPAAAFGAREGVPFEAVPVDEVTRRPDRLLTVSPPGPKAGRWDGVYKPDPSVPPK